MMTNGMQESLDKTEKLPDTEPETFILFSEFAYTSVYRYSIKEEAKEPDDQAANSDLDHYTSEWRICTYCGAGAVYEGDGIAKPITGSYPNRCSQSSGFHRHYMICGRFSTLSLGFSLCNNCGGSNMNAAPAVIKTFAKSPRMVSTNLASSSNMALGQKEYLGRGKDDLKLQECLDMVRAKDIRTVDISRPAQLYVFASQYMVEPLKKICLHKLRQDLSELKPNESNIEEIVTMLVYTYDNSTAGKGDGIGEDLRELVIKYAVWKAEVLVKYDLFKAMLMSGGQVVADFTCLMAERMKS